MGGNAQKMPYQQYLENKGNIAELIDPFTQYIQHNYEHSQLKGMLYLILEM